jgi:hypothetical protein
MKTRSLLERLIMANSTQDAKTHGSAAATSTVARGAVTQPPTTPAQIGPVHDSIRQRAYEKWLKRGRPANSSLRDWLEAEAEIKSEMRAGRKT